MMMSLINGSSSYKLNQLASTEQDTLKIERQNLLNIFRLVIKDLIQTSSGSIQNAENFDKNEKNLTDFFDVFENILNHGFKGSKKSFYTGYQRNDYSSILDIIEVKLDSLNSNLKSIKDMSGIKTSLGRLRAWIRLLVMQKDLADTFMKLIEEKDSLKEVYEVEAILLADEANVVAGLLIGLNGLDFSIDLKSVHEALDLPIRIVNYSTYLRERIPEIDDEAEKKIQEEEEEHNNKLYELQNQKNYLEEINKILKSQSEQSKERIAELEVSNESQKKELLDYKVENLDLKSMSESLQAEKDKLEHDYKVKYDSIFMDQMTERETFIQSRNGLDAMYMELQKKVVEESKNKISLENELKTQQLMKGELESALKLMDYSLVEKQGTVNKLREQLEQVKAINLEFNSKLQGFDAEKNALESDIELQKESLKKSLESAEDLKQKLKISEEALKQKTKQFEKVSNDLTFYQKCKEELEVDLQIEKNWRTQLQAELASQKEMIRKLNEEVALLNVFKDENIKLKIESSNLKLENAELERTLEEMGSKLGNSVEKMEDIKEATKQISGFHWEQDEEVAACNICKNEFNVARRKHHCRRCGRIFCHDCSDNKMPLPSFSKPMRVCDPCCLTMVQNSIAPK